MNRIMRDDLERLAGTECIPWERLRGKTVLVTGATGLIGSNIVHGMAYVSGVLGLGIKTAAIVRDEKKARAVLDNGAELIIGNVEDVDASQIGGGIDYIIHAASPTASSFFLEKPVETTKTALLGTMNMLELARAEDAEGFAYLSSMEVYGAPRTDDVLGESDLGYMDTLRVRNCYPMGKRQCEAMCAAYAAEYGVPAVSVRLAQTFGPGVDKNDGRVYAEFARCALGGENITLLTDGTSKRCYLYTMDAVSAIFTAMLKGEAGSAYNAANPATYCSVREMAQLVSQTLGRGRIGVEIREDAEKSRKFSPPHCYNLGTAKLASLGWKPTKGLEEMYEGMVEGWR